MKKILTILLAILLSACNDSAELDDVRKLSAIQIILEAEFYTRALAETQAAANLWNAGIQVSLGVQNKSNTIYFTNQACENINLPQKYKDQCPLSQFGNEYLVLGACVAERSSNGAMSPYSVMIIRRDNFINSPIPVQTVLAHEIGHCIGFPGNPHPATGIMASPPLSNTPTGAEIAAVQSVYPDPDQTKAQGAGFTHYIQYPLNFTIVP